MSHLRHRVRNVILFMEFLNALSSFLTLTCRISLDYCLRRKMDLLKTIPTHMDFDGQGRAEKYSRFIIALFGVVGLIWGYIIQQFSQTVYILGAGFVLAALIAIPPWPMYRRKSLQWQKPRPDSDYHNESSGKSKKKK